MHTALCVAGRWQDAAATACGMLPVVAGTLVVGAVSCVQCVSRHVVDAALMHVACVPACLPAALPSGLPLLSVRVLS